MEWFAAFGVVVLTGVVLVGLFLGPTHRPARRRAPAPGPTITPSAPTGRPSTGQPSSGQPPTTEPPPRDKPVYQLPPPSNRLGDRTRLTRPSTRRRPRGRP